VVNIIKNDVQNYAIKTLVRIGQATDTSPRSPDVGQAAQRPPGDIDAGFIRIDRLHRAVRLRKRHGPLAEAATRVEHVPEAGESSCPNAGAVDLGVGAPHPAEEIAIVSGEPVAQREDAHPTALNAGASPPT